MMARVRSAAPVIEAGLSAGHSIRTILERLNQDGLAITYGCLINYRYRMRRGKEKVGILGQVVPHNPVESDRSDITPATTSPDGFDPEANFRKQLKKRPNLEYPSGPPDEGKLY